MRAYTADDTIRGQILALIVELSDETTSTASPTAVLQRTQEIQPEMSSTTFNQHLEFLESRGLVTAQRNAGGDAYIVAVTPDGRDTASAFIAERDNPVLRRKHLQDDYLRWLYTRIEIEDGSPTPTEYLTTSPTFLGSPYTAKELEKAGGRLRDAAYIDGPGAWQYDAPIRPRLTAKGRHTVESGRSVHDTNDAPPPVQNISTVVHGNANVAVGDHASQTMTVNNAWPEKVTAFLDALAQASPTLPVELQDALQPHVQEVQQGVTQKDPSKVRAALTAIGGFLGAVSSGTLANILATQLQPLLDLLP